MLAELEKKDKEKAIIPSQRNKGTQGLLISYLVQSHDLSWGTCVNVHFMSN